MSDGAHDSAGLDRRAWLAASSLLVIGLGLALPFLGASSLWDPWEPKYAQTAREMSQRGDPIVPHFRDEPRLNRPPLTYWLIGASQAIFGDDETGARLPSALLAVLCPVVLCLAFAARGRPLEGWLCGAALLTAPQWLLLGRFATISMPLAAILGLLLALALAAPPLRRHGLGRPLAVAAVVLVAAAALTNFPRGLLLPAWAALGWFALEQPRRGVPTLVALGALYHVAQLTHSPWLNLSVQALVAILAVTLLARTLGLSPRATLGALALLALLVLPWFVAVVRLEQESVKLFNYKYGLNLGESAGEHGGPYDYLFRILLVGALPWAAAALAGGARALGRSADPTARILAGTLLGGMVFFTLAEPRMGHFYVVLQPALAGLAALGLVEIVRRRDWTGLLPLGLLVGIWWLVWRDPSLVLETATVRRALFGTDLLAPVSVAAAVWAIVVFAAWTRRRPAWLTLSLLPALGLAGLLAFHTVPTLGPVKSFGTIWNRYVEEHDGVEPIGLYGRSEASAFYYSDNRIARLYGPDELSEFLDGPGIKYLIVSDRELERSLPLPLVGGGFDLVDESHPSHTLVRYLPPR